jgi:hypothetical protein
MAAIFLVGIVAYTQLPVSALPEVDYPTIQVVTAIYHRVRKYMLPRPRRDARAPAAQAPKPRIRT